MRSGRPRLLTYRLVDPTDTYGDGADVSNTAIVTISITPVSTTVPTVTPEPATYGDPASVDAVVHCGTQLATGGTVTFTISPGSITLLASRWWQATTVALPTLPVATYSVQAAYRATRPVPRARAARRTSSIRDR